MDVLEPLLIVYGVMVGLGTWLPAAPAGVRLIVGGAAIPLTLFFGNFVLGARLSVVAYAMAAAAALGLVVRLRPAARTIRWSGLAAHPVVVLPVLFVAVTLVSGYHGYAIFLGDEFSNWLYWTKEAWLRDTVLHPAMKWRGFAYTQGWPTALALPQLFHADFDLGRALVVAFLWHVAAIGVVYDMLVRAFHGRCGLDRTPAAALAWTMILALLAIEATWTLAPQNLLIERPQIYMLAGILGVAGLAALEDGASRSLALAAGVLMATAYLLKVTTMGFMPALVLISLAPAFRGSRGWWIEDRAEARRLATVLACVLGPPLLTYAAWRLWLPFDPPRGCVASPLNVFQVADAVGGPEAGVGARFLDRLGDYLAGFKLPLTLVAGAGIVAGLRDRRLFAVAAPLALYAVVYLASLYILYAVCFQGYERETFASLQRYVRVPLRLIHLFGPLLLVLAVMPWLAGSWETVFRTLPGRQSIRMAGAIFIAVLLAYQARALDDALRNAALRDRETPDTVRNHEHLKAEAMQLRALIGRLDLKSPRVAIIAQGGVGDALNVARYWSLGDRRGGGPHYYRVAPPYSWGPVKANLWMTASRPAAVRAHLAGFDLIWPYRTDAWMVSILGDLVDDADCATRAQRYFLVATGGPNRSMRCVAKLGRGQSSGPAKTSVR